MADLKIRGKMAGRSDGVLNYGRRKDMLLCVGIRIRGWTAIWMIFPVIGARYYVDLMHGLDYVTKNYSFIDDKMAAAGASYGYMMNWFEGRRAIQNVISHCGVYNFRCMRQRMK